MSNNLRFEISKSWEDIGGSSVAASYLKLVDEEGEPYLKLLSSLSVEFSVNGCPLPSIVGDAYHILHYIAITNISWKGHPMGQDGLEFFRQGLCKNAGRGMKNSDCERSRFDAFFEPSGWHLNHQVLRWF